MTATEKTQTLPEGTIHYWTYNPTAKKTMLMIHGFRGTHHGLERIIGELGEYKIIVPDLPGFGASPAMKSATHNVENYAKLLLEFIDALKLKQPILFGHSMGSIIAADMVARRPGVTEKLVCVNPVASRPTQGIGVIKIAPGIAYHYLAGKWLPEKIGMKILRNKQLFIIGSATMTKTKDKELRKWIHWNHVTYMKQFSDRKTLLEAYTSSSTATIRDYAERLDVPILLVAGKKDAIAPIKSQRSLVKQLPNATLIELDNVGHIVHYEKPTEAAAVIREFLSQ